MKLISEKGLTYDPQFDTLIFLHFPKTGGSTLRTIIERQFVGKSTYSRYREWERPESLVRVPIATRRELKLLYGHIGFGWHRFLPQGSVYVTMLRNPVDRVISEYYYLNTRKDLPFFNMLGRGITIEEYMRRNLNKDSTNLQTRWIAGEEFLPHPYSSKELLALARENLENHFLWVGLTERFDESLLLLQQVFKWRWVYYMKTNVTRVRPRRESLQKRAIEIIQEMNQADIQLYNYMEANFSSLWRLRSPSLRCTLDEFQEKNRTYGKYLARILDIVPRLRETIVAGDSPVPRYSHSEA